MNSFPAMRDKQVAEYLDISVKTLKRMNDEGTGPDFFVVRGSKRYLRETVEKWAKENQTNGRQVIKEGDG